VVIARLFVRARQRRHAIDWLSSNPLEPGVAKSVCERERERKREREVG
jgi:hypothetical protein